MDARVERADIDEAVERDLDGFESVVARHAPRIRSLLLRLVDDVDVVDDLVQSTFLRAFRAAASFEGRSSVGTWLSQIAINLARDHHRTCARRPEVTLGESDEVDPAFPRLVDTEAPDAVFDATRLADELEVALRNLPTELREAFVLRHVEGLSYDDIARISGANVGAVKVRVHRARKRLLSEVHPLRAMDEGVPDERKE